MIFEVSDVAVCGLRVCPATSEEGMDMPITIGRSFGDKSSFILMGEGTKLRDCVLFDRVASLLDIVGMVSAALTTPFFFFQKPPDACKDSPLRA